MRFETTFDYFLRTRVTVLWLIVTTLISLYIPGCIGAVAETGNAKWSLKAGTHDNFEPTLVVAGRVRGVVAEECYVQCKFRWCQAKLVVNKRWSLTRVVVQEGNYSISFGLLSPTVYGNVILMLTSSLL